MTVNKATSLVNHVVFVLDKSGSMRNAGIDTALITVFDEQVKHLAKISQEANQETRVSVFLFGSNVECVIYDTDVLRVPSIATLYSANDGSTAMIDGTIQTITDMQLISEKYGNHAFLIYVLTDGGENVAPEKAPLLKALIKKLPDNYTVGCLIPDQTCLFHAKNYGFPAENCQLWDTSKKGLDKVNDIFKTSTQNFMKSRATGQRNMNGGMFKVDLSKIDAKTVQKSLEFLPFSDFEIAEVKKDARIDDFVEYVMKLGFQKGKGFYQLMKTEEVQDYKEICVRDTRNGNVYTGANARALIGLPLTTAKVKPEACGTYEVFVQSTSVNRKLIAGTKILYLTK